jgi:hypothetical protein
VKTYILLLLFAINANCFAQTPGYLGHRFDLEVKAGGAPAMYFLADEGVESFHWASQLDAAAHYTLSRKISIGAYYARSSSTMQPSRNDFSGWEIPREGVTVNTTKFSIEGRYYMSDFLAPLGTYFSFGIGKITYQYEPGTTDLVYNVYTYDPFWGSHLAFTVNPTFEESFSTRRYSFGFGNSSLIAGSVYFSKSISTNLTFRGMRAAEALYPTDYAEEFWREWVPRIWTENLLQFHLGIGVML